MKTFLMIIFFILLCVPIVRSHPPSKVELSYDHDSQVLSIDIWHLSRDLKDHYIRRIEVTHKKNKPQVFYLNRQTKKNHFKYEVDLKADAEDTVKVKINCIKGGTKSVVFVIPEQEEEDNEEQSTEKKQE
ncbi:MAG: hypothetical protein K8S27_16460 [Candidatus Omnitrophica bacterium]|nr:hypothetical protein [Candidatus Omnitrophota bacterium]